jgi:hypothetical protein
VSDEPRPSDEVEVQIVDVPVERSTWPRVPDALVESLNNPVRERSEVNKLVAVIPVAEALESVV